MRVLITSARMPFALAMARKLADVGHEVYAADNSALAPGSHSKYLSGHFVTASPRAEPEQFVADVERIADEQSIDVVVPAFEEVFFLATKHERISGATRLFAPPFATLARLHDKISFQRLAVRLGPSTPETVVATSDEQLRPALERFPRYFARVAFSRGGVSLLTTPARSRARSMSPIATQRRPRRGWCRSSLTAPRSARTARCRTGRRAPTACTGSRASGSTRPGSASSRSTAANRWR